MWLYIWAASMSMSVPCLPRTPARATAISDKVVTTILTGFAQNLGQTERENAWGFRLIPLRSYAPQVL